MEGIENGIDITTTMALHNRSTDSIRKQPIEELPPVDEYFNTGPEPQQLEESDADNVKSSNLLPDECGILRNILVGMIYTYAERGAHMWTPLKFQDSDGRCPH